MIASLPPLITPEPPLDAAPTIDSPKYHHLLRTTPEDMLNVFHVMDITRNGGNTMDVNSAMAAVTLLRLRENGEEYDDYDEEEMEEDGEEEDAG